MEKDLQEGASCCWKVDTTLPKNSAMSPKTFREMKTPKNTRRKDISYPHCLFPMPVRVHYFSFDPSLQKKNAPGTALFSVPKGHRHIGGQGIKLHIGLRSAGIRDISFKALNLTKRANITQLIKIKKKKTDNLDLVCFLESTSLHKTSLLLLKPEKGLHAQSLQKHQLQPHKLPVFHPQDPPNGHGTV